MSDLPIGWTASALIDLIGKGGLFSDGDWVESKDQDPNGTIRLLQLADIGDGKFLNKSHRFVNDEKFELLNFTEVLEGDVLVARMPEPLGRSCLMPNLPHKCITVVDVAIVRPGTQSVSTNWLMYFLNSPEIRQKIQLLSSGTTRKRISRSNLAQIEIPIPPRNEQQRIAKKLESLFARVDSCKSHLDHVPQILKRFRQSVLAAATSGSLTEDWRAENINPLKYRSVILREVATRFSYGTSAKSQKSGKVPVLRMGNIQDGKLDWTDLVFTSNKEEVKKFKLVNGDVLFNRTNSPELVGKTAVYKGEKPAIYAGYLIRIKCGNDLLPDFLSYCLNGPSGRDWAWRVKSDSVSQSNINAQKLADFELELPPVEEQAEIVRRVESLFVYAERLASRYYSINSQLEHLTPSLLAKAFHGELVEQDPNDESAEKLLQNIIEVREIEKERRKTEPRKKKENKMRAKIERKSLHETLLEKGTRLTPEDLFEQAGFDESNVDEFYEELRAEIKKKRIEEIRQGTEKVYLKGISK
jgi:type I restriction enzyme S subunit